MISWHLPLWSFNSNAECAHITASSTLASDPYFIEVILHAGCPFVINSICKHTFTLSSKIFFFFFFFFTVTYHANFQNPIFLQKTKKTLQLKTELATYRTIAADREQSIQALQKEVKSTVDEVERLRAALLEKTIALETKGGDAEQVRSRDVKIESLCAELAKTEATLSQKQQSLANAQQRMDRMVKDISDLQKSLADTQEIVVEREYDIGVLIEDAEEAKAEKEQLASDRAELKRIKAKKTALEADLRTAKRDVKKYELASSSREMEFMELESALTSTRLSCDRRSAALKVYPFFFFFLSKNSKKPKIGQNH